MINLKNLFAAFLTMTGLFASVETFAAVPSPPPTVCIDNNCTTTDAPTTPGVQSIRWHPGHYALLTPIMYNTSVTYAQGLHFPIIAEICKSPAWKGVELYMTWGAYETGENNFTQGRAILKQYLDKLSACGKYLQLSIVYANYTGNTCNIQLPSYIINGPSYGTTVGDSGGRALCYSRFWQQATMDRYIAVMKDIGTQFGNHPAFEMIFFWELLAPGVPEGKDGWSESAMATQAIRWLAGTRSAMPKQQVRLGVNWWTKDAGIVPLLEACRKYACSWNSSDSSTLSAVQGNQVHAGYFRNSSGAWVKSGTDYRGIIPMIGQTEWWKKASAADTWRYVNSDYTTSSGAFVPNSKPSYFNWSVNTWDTGTGWHWSQVRTLVESTLKGSILNTECPKAFTGGCDRS